MLSRSAFTILKSWQCISSSAIAASSSEEEALSNFPSTALLSSNLFNLEEEGALESFTEALKSSKNVKTESMSKMIESLRAHLLGKLGFRMEIMTVI